MQQEFSNVYDDSTRAEAYDRLEFPGTYWLAYRDLPEIIKEHVKGKEALDFGCGTGRSTRFLKTIGLDPVGVDISQEMLKRARERDPEGSYILVPDGDLSQFQDRTFDVVFSLFTFDNIPNAERKVRCFREMGRLLKDTGKIVNLVSSPLIYTHEWASFTTKDYPENKHARSGDVVRIVMKDVEDRRPVEDILWTDESYQDAYEKSDLKILKTYRPLGREDEPFQWVSETSIPPWVVYILQRGG